MPYTFATRTAGLRSSANRDLLKHTEMSHMLSLAGGLPTPASFPLPDLSRGGDRLLGDFIHPRPGVGPAAAESALRATDVARAGSNGTSSSPRK